MRLRVLFLCGRSTACVPFSIPNTLSGLDQQSPGRLIPFPVSIVSYENYRGETSAAIFIPKARNDRAQGLKFLKKVLPPDPPSITFNFTISYRYHIISGIVPSLGIFPSAFSP